ncbi:MAG: phosphatase PAP2 family protein, partial [Actinobacteria bacterium]|nr:phosphatase PAP2 family protein [Actinomycetota bacterium]
QATAGWFDRTVDSPIIAWAAGHRGLALGIAYAGTLIPAGLVTAAIVAGCLLARRPGGAVLAVAAVPAAVGLVEGLLKPLIHRTYLGALVYPSGHTTAVFALATVLTVLLMPPAGRRGPRALRALRVLIPAAAAVLACLVAVAVTGLRWHYFTDTVAGAAVGIGTVLALALILDLPAVRRLLGAAGGRPAIYGLSWSACPKGEETSNIGRRYSSAARIRCQAGLTGLRRRVGAIAGGRVAGAGRSDSPRT